MSNEQQSSTALPQAVWEGSIFGVRVYVLEDGRRIVNAEDVQRILNAKGPAAVLVTMPARRLPVRLRQVV